MAVCQFIQLKGHKNNHHHNLFFIMTRNIFFIFCIIAVLPSFLSGQTATVDLSNEEQLIKGYGAINHPIWYTDINAAERELAFGNGDGQMGLTVLRIWVSDNPDQWALELPTAKKAVEHGVTVFATPWNPPVNMTTTDASGQKMINPDSYAAYAKHLNDFVTYMRDNGVELYAISTQNEPDYAHDWTEWTPQQSVDFIKGYADQIDCRLMSPESFQYRKNIYDPILNDPDALSKVDVFGTHLYGTQVADFAYPLFQQKGAGKELWMTEVYTDSGNDANLWPMALDAAEHIHNAMVVGRFQTYVWWPMRRYYALIHDGDAGHGNDANLADAGTVTKRGWCMAHFSKFIRPGYVRVAADDNPTYNVYVSAYKDPATDAVTVVAVNKSTEAKTISFSIPGTAVTSWERYVTSASKSMNKEANVEAGGSFEVTLEPQSVTTFAGEGVTGKPSVSILTPKENSVYVSPATITVLAEASDDDGSVGHVDFYLNDIKIESLTAAPFEFDIPDLEAGVYTIKAVVFDNDEKTSEDLAEITVNVPQSPYGGSPHAIPGSIELEEYDLGGNGFAYYDDTPGSETGVEFRSDEDVDLEECTDTNGGYNLGWTSAGEWLEYTVDVKTTGTYELLLRAACNGDGRTVTIQVDGKDIVTELAITNTADWQAWDDVTLSDIELTKGEHIVKLIIGDTDFVNLNYMTFTLTSEPVQPVQLYKGWNIIGCPIEGATDVNQALSSIMDHLLVVKDFDGFMDVNISSDFHSLTKLEWGKGYLVKVDADCELIW